MHFLVKGQSDHGFHPKTLPKEPLPVGQGVDEPGSLPQHQGIRMDPEGNDPQAAPGLGGQLPARFQQGPVADMDPVKKAQGINRLFVHCVSLRLKKTFDR